MKKKEAKYPIPIREWSENDRPREKLLKYGEHTPCNVYLACPARPVECETYSSGVGQNDRTGACPACPVAPGDGTGIGSGNPTGVNSFSTCLLAKSDRIGADRIDLLNRGDAIPLRVQLFFKQGSYKAPPTHIEGGAFLFCLPHEAGP